LKCYDGPAGDVSDVDIAVGELSGHHNSVTSSSANFDFLNAGSGKIFNRNLVQMLKNFLRP
jgi:hypothetical protein